MEPDQSPYFLRIEIPDLPKTINQIGRKHWAVKKKEIDKWHSLVRLCVGAKAPKVPLNKAKLRLIRISSREMDFDNLVNSFKGVLDSLIKCGVIENDKMSNIGQPEYVWLKGKQKDGKVIIEVEGIF